MLKDAHNRIVIWLVMFSMLLVLFPGAVLAADKPAVTLEKAITTVKSAFEVPKGFTNFSSGYNKYDDREVWSLNWNAENAKGGSMNSEVDARTGEILNMYLWQTPEQSQIQTKLPVITRNEAVKIGDKLLGRLLAGHQKDLVLQSGDGELLPLTSWGPVTYRLYWQRLVNGVPFSEDGVSIGVDNQTGQITDYNYHWTAGEFPDSTKAITSAQAREVFDEGGFFRLQYFRPYSSVKGQKRPVMLVYRLDDNYGGTIDALTGKPVDLNGGWTGGGGMGGANEKQMSDSRNTPIEVPLTPEEIGEIEQAAKIIPQEEAQAEVSKWVYIADDLKLQNVNLYSNEYDDPQLRTWSFSWSDVKTAVDRPAYLNARVNAVTGELLGFDRNVPLVSLESRQGTKQLSREESRKIVEDFLKKIQPERFSQVKLQENGDPVYKPLAEGEQTPNSNFTYWRTVNGLSFPDHGFSVAVNTETGEIASYDFRWSDLEFPLLEGVLDRSTATDRYLTRQPLSLQYIQIYSPNGDREIRLVYRPLSAANAPQEAMTDAWTGVALDWEGKPLANQPRPYRFVDISGNRAEKEISLLGQAGIFGDYLDKFRPGQAISAVQLLRAMIGAHDGVLGSSSLSDVQVMEQARQNGWVKEKMQPEVGLNREQLAVLMVRYLGLDRAAKVKGIYKVNFTDTSKIASGNLGYVALSQGLGIMMGGGGQFNPAGKVTRAEAAVVLIRTLKAGA
ncbi:MAG: PepSY domain-containing protein [Bacillota bacterium]